MHSVKLETVTPLFLGGSNPRGEPELRAPSFRGVMRFWLRALLGGVLGDNPQKIFEHESKVFGSTQFASPVVVRVQHQKPSSVGYSQISQNHTGIGYLFFGARGFRDEPERKAIQNGFKFTCTISLRAGAKDPKTLQAAYASLWLLTHLGGLGMRSRKGGGNLQVVSTNWNEPSLPPLPLQAKTPEQLRKELRDGLTLLREWAVNNFDGSLNPPFQNPPAFDVLHPNLCSIFVVNQQFSGWAEALNAFGQAMQQFRNRYNPDYSNVKAVIQGKGQLQPVKRAAFGLPIVFYFRSLNERATLEGAEHDRRSSPLLVRVTRLANGECTLVVTLFRSPLLPTGERLQLRRGERIIGSSKQPSDDILNEFLNHLQRVSPLLEVTGW